MIVLDTQGLFAGQTTLGQTSWGVLGSEVSSGGTTGASPLFNDISLPADANTEFLLIQESNPSAGTVTWDDFGGFTFTGAPDGTYSFTARLRTPGQDLGVETITMVVGAGALLGVTSFTGYGIGSSESFGTPTVVGRTVALLAFTGNGIASGEAFGVPTLVGLAPTTGSVVFGGYGIASQEVFGLPTFTPKSTGGLAPFTPVGRVRLKIGDYSDLPLLPDAVIYTALEDCNGNVNRASSLCAQYILGLLTSRTHKRLAQLETWSGEQFTNYVKFLQMTVLNPHLTTVAPVPYSGAGNEDHSIQDFLQDWKDGYLPGSVVIPPQVGGRVIEYAFT